MQSKEARTLYRHHHSIIQPMIRVYRVCYTSRELSPVCTAGKCIILQTSDQKSVLFVKKFPVSMLYEEPSRDSNSE